MTMTMKSKFAFGGLMVVVATLSGCATQVKSLPLAPVVAQSPQSAPGAQVALYFGSQDHPAVQSQQGPTTASVRIARGRWTGCGMQPGAYRCAGEATSICPRSSRECRYQRRDEFS